MLSSSSATSTAFETGIAFGFAPAALPAKAPVRSVPATASSAADCQNRLVQVRLGIASGLFLALRAKHGPTADHSLRVALLCSAWSELLQLGERERDELEVAALLHDIGKIGVPDSVLTKPGRLTDDEMAVLNRSRHHGLEILAACCASRGVWETVHYRPAWFDGSRREFDRQGTALPQAARMLAIADAFDAMTSDTVFRSGMAQERAIAELTACAGTQFDPGLVEPFRRFLAGDRAGLNARLARRWLQPLAEDGGGFWRLQESRAATGSSAFDGQFHRHLLENMNEAVILVDQHSRIMRWNRAAESLTGRAAEAMLERHWEPGLLELRDERMKLLPPEKCPVAESLQAGATFTRRLHVTNGRGDKVAVMAVISAIQGGDGEVLGATLILRDASSEAVLQERVESLHAKATQDPLTGVANRAEFDRAHREFVQNHLRRGEPGSLIICDLDFFKKINDRFGHQAGDEALMAFAALLHGHQHAGDLVARYGGEEFVLLCANTRLESAAERAEIIRQALAARPQLAMGGACITASFGVTELQSGDTPETMLRRADRALLQAKEDGRNKVVQLGLGRDSTPRRGPTGRGWLGWLHGETAEPLLERQLITSVPMTLAAEKLRGFISDHQATVVSIQQNLVHLHVAGRNMPALRRRHDKRTDFLIDLHFDEVHLDRTQEHKGIDVRTIVQVKIRPKRQRDRRNCRAIERARLLFISIKSYLAAQDYLEAWR